MNVFPYNIVIATDDNYAIHARTLIRSIKANESHPICIWVLGFNLSASNLNKFAGLTDGSLSIKIIPLDQSMLATRLLKSSSLSGDRSLATYARLLIPEILPSDISICVYMDVDAVVMSSIAPMFEMDLTGYAAAGVPDTNPVWRHRAVGLLDDDLYINAGMIVWNLEWCREHGVVDKFADFITRRKGVVDAMDQGTFNGVLSKHIKPLAPKYNALTSFFQLDSDGIQAMWGRSVHTQAEISEAVENPIFIHFTPNHTTRPWVKNCRHPRRHEYWKYREDGGTPKLQPDTRPAKLKFLGWLFYHLPLRLFCMMIRCVKQA